MKKSEIKDLLRSQWKILLSKEEIDEKLSFVQNNVSVSEHKITLLYTFVGKVFKVNILIEDLCESSLENCTNIIFKKINKHFPPKK